MVPGRYEEHPRPLSQDELRSCCPMRRRANAKKPDYSAACAFTSTVVALAAMLSVTGTRRSWRASSFVLWTTAFENPACSTVME